LSLGTDNNRVFATDLVGVEIAGEIISKFPAKTVILVEKKDRILSRYKKSVSRKAQAYLEQMGVRIFLEEEIISQDPISGFYTSDSGKLFQVDYCYVATGITKT
jgi:NADH dehydrogenase FAD-containing subunit